jgi:glycosyltransferase involved in cell wall biosynthesis
MKVLILVSKAVLGGHILSAFTVAKRLQQRGHTIIFSGGEGKLTEMISAELPFIDVSIPLYHGRRESYFTWNSLGVIPRLREIIREHDVDIIHAFDARAYTHVTLAALLEKKPVTCTLCGGIDPHYNLPQTCKIIVFSEEQRNKMLQQYGWHRQQIEVIRNRVDISSIVNDPSPLPVPLSLEPKAPLLMMISSFDTSKKDSILRVMEALELLLAQHIYFQMVFIGGEGPFFEKMKKRGAEINHRHSKEIFIFTGPVVNAYKLLRDATIVLGVGRSAFEGMAYEKPTIVVGATGFAGIVSEQTVDDIAFYNFSGRNQKILAAADHLVQALTSLLSDKDQCKVVGRFGADYVAKEIDVRGGLERIEEVYRINMDGNTPGFRFRQLLSVCAIMVPIWRDNWWHTLGVPLKRMLGRKGILDEQV